MFGLRRATHSLAQPSKRLCHPARATNPHLSVSSLVRTKTNSAPLVYHLVTRNIMTTPAGTVPSGALTAAIAEDHQEMYEYFDQYKTARSSGDLDTAERWARQLIWEVARHAVGEEIVVYPLMEKHLGERGLSLANQDREDHQVSVHYSLLYRQFNIYFDSL